MIKPIILIAAFMLPTLCRAYEPSRAANHNVNHFQKTENNFFLIHDLTSVSVKDVRNREWDGGYYTQNPTVNVSYECADNSNINSVKVAVAKCNGIVKANNTYTFLVDAVIENFTDIDIKAINIGETEEFDVSIPGRYCLAYCALDKKNELLYSGSILFDSLYDDGNWTICGEADLSSGVLSSNNHISHVFISNGTGLMENPGDFIWWECPVTYPYYSGESWTASIEYNPILKSYRIVNPFVSNPAFKDYIPEDDELLCAHYSNVDYTPEGFLFDHDHPAWFLLNAESESDAYCEPIRTGVVAMHRENPYCYIAHPYNQNIGYVIYDECPTQNIRRTGKYIDMPLSDENEASLTVQFPKWISGVDEIDNDNDVEKEYFTIDGVKTVPASKGVYIVRQGAKSKKIIR